MSANHAEHWNRVYAEKDSKILGWYESSPETSLELLARCNLTAEARILIAGTGTTTLVDALLAQGFTGLIATDLSVVALEKLQQRLGAQAALIDWVVDDLRAPRNLDRYAGQIDLWQDRAVLHFLISEEERSGYRETLLKLVKPGGCVLLACFAPGTAERCSGLPVRHYAVSDFQDWLGEGFALLESRVVDYTQPSGGIRTFTHALFRRH